MHINVSLIVNIVGNSNTYFKSNKMNFKIKYIHESNIKVIVIKKINYLDSIRCRLCTI
jgi:hypothetical protein